MLDCVFQSNFSFGFCYGVFRVLQCFTKFNWFVSSQLIKECVYVYLLVKNRLEPSVKSTTQ